MTVFKSGAGYKGFPEKETTGLAYLYGLSDFWSVIFEDSQLFDRMLEANSIGLADVYAKFLQLTSTVSINDIQSFLYSEVKLLQISNSDSVPSLSGTTYSIPEEIVSCRYLLDKPMLATNTLERGVHFDIDEVNHTITFYKSLTSLGFPTRVSTSGSTEVAFWMTDVELDDSLVYKYFGKLINIEPQNVSRTYRDFVRGLYFLYTQGPTITLLERGLSLALGIPVCRVEGETVLLTARNETTGNWLVATDRFSYVIPYGIEPEVSPGDVLSLGQEMVKIAEVKDYKVEDEWWINISIPEELLPTLDDGQRLATEGSLADDIMRQYLKTHTFLVRLRWDNAFTSDSFEEVFNLLYDVKPSYTYPVFVWSVTDTDELVFNDDSLEYSSTYQLVDSFGCGGAYLQRNVERFYERSNACFIHGNFNPEEITNPAAEVTVNYKVKASAVYNEVSPTDESIPDSDLVPLYNTTALDVKQSFASQGITLPNVMPRLMLVKNVPITTSSYNQVVVREPVESGFSGVTRNITPLDFPSSLEHHAYQAYVPDQGSLNATEHFFILEVQSNFYSVMMYRPGEPALLDPAYFPRAEEDPIRIFQISDTVDQLTYYLGSPDLTLSNSNFTVSGNV